MVLIRHKTTDVELDVPEEALPYFPDYEAVKSEPSSGEKSTAKPTTSKE